ncbi:hypothetical protein ATE84_4952 [Aquimarina sp. MAR_2010_214]|uniref:hypothetical protein n=1 Tax=Aquimarina sp. MAR_2010_214 TaxID=1250026 RepID=UPI000C708DD6|nr:hypothetical protein [Aquimarina sp. MAR_2010_214]PKV52824.1 hypothetical protein ATE84_4952 [Aquimarina sp. MAR_2010_214]
MRNQIILLACSFIFITCNKSETAPTISKSKEVKKIEGAWKMVYGEIKEGDSVKIKDMTTSDFIKIIGKDHFAFFNQDHTNPDGFYGGGGTYTLEGNTYTETLQYCAVEAVRGHKFPFTVEIKGDTLIQYGLEEVKEANIKRYVVEKYIRKDK